VLPTAADQRTFGPLLAAAGRCSCAPQGKKSLGYLTVKTLVLRPGSLVFLHRGCTETLTAVTVFEGGQTGVVKVVGQSVPLATRGAGAE